MICLCIAVSFLVNSENNVEKRREIRRNAVGYGPATRRRRTRGEYSFVAGLG